MANDNLVQYGLAQLGAIAPKAALLFAMLIGGFVVARLLRRGTGWVVRKSGLETLLEKAGVAKLLYKAGWKDGATPILQALVYYVVWLATAAAIAEVLGLSGVKDGLAKIIAFLPRLMSSGLVLLGGLWLAGLARGLVDRLTQRGKETEGKTSAAGQLSYGLVLVLSSTVALSQLGIEVGLLSSLIQIVLGAAVFALALAFALGGKTAFENLVARHYYAALVSPGDRIRVGEHEGTVVRLTPVAVVLATSRGEQVIPCSTLLTGATEIRRLGGAQNPASTPDVPPSP